MELSCLVRWRLSLSGFGCRLSVMNAATAALLANTLLTLHVGVVVFVVGLLPLVLIGC